MKTERIGFSTWNENDLNLANQLWGDRNVTRFICATGVFTKQEILKRMNTEIQNEQISQVQYWPFFELSTGKFIGCCGLRTFKSEIHSYEMGFHLCTEYWGKGYASEAAKAVIVYAFDTLKANKIYAGHHPQNDNSKKLLIKLGFHYIGKNYYEPTGLYHPSYELKKIIYTKEQR